MLHLTNLNSTYMMEVVFQWHKQGFTFTIDVIMHSIRNISLCLMQFLFMIWCVKCLNNVHLIRWCIYRLRIYFIFCPTNQIMLIKWLDYYFFFRLQKSSWMWTEDGEDDEEAQAAGIGFGMDVFLDIVYNNYQETKKV